MSCSSAGNPFDLANAVTSSSSLCAGARAAAASFSRSARELSSVAILEAIDRSAKQSKPSRAAFSLRRASVRSMMAVLSPSAPTVAAAAAAAGSPFFSAASPSSSFFFFGDAARVTYARYISSLRPRSLACCSTGM